MLVAVTALFIALGGPAQAAKLLDGGKIRTGTVTGKQVKDRSLKARELAPGAVRALTATPDRSVGDAELADNAITTRTLAPGSVLSGTVADDSLSALDLGANAVGPDELADNAVGQTEIRNNGGGASEIADNAVDTGEVIDGGLSVRDIARQTGTFEWPIPDLPKSTCVVATVPVAGIAIAGDYVLASPTSAWPSQLVYTINGTSAEASFKVQACNRGTSDTPFTGATYTFNYAVLAY
jgi:hypothetical protein